MNGIVESILAQGPVARAQRQQIIAECARRGVPLKSQALHAWKKLKHGVPAARAPIVAHVMKLHVHDVRPDIFPPPTRRKPKRGRRRT